MHYTFTLLENVYMEAHAYFQKFGQLESAGYIFARTSTTEDEVRLIGRKFVPVDEADVIDRSEVGVSIDSRSFMRALRHADETQQCLIFVHSHPGNFDCFSEKDDREEPPFFRTAYIRAKSMQPRASVVFQGDGRVFGRVWLADGTQQPFSRIRVIGDRVRFFDSDVQANISRGAQARRRE
jgi:proteasome lid subunit RPN8/RPN11